MAAIACNSTTKITASWRLANNLIRRTSTDSGASFGGGNVIEQAVAQHASAIDSKGVVHWCLRNSTNFLNYLNDTDIDPNPTNNLGGSSQFCDIEVDENDDIYIISEKTDTSNLVISSSRDGYGSKNIVSSVASFTDNSIYAPSLAIRDGNIYIAFEDNQDLQFCRGNITDWNQGAGLWECQEIDANSYVLSDIAVNNDGQIYIMYNNDSVTFANLTYANSSDIGTTWQVDRKHIVPETGVLGSSIADSVWAESNRMTNKLHFVYNDVVGPGTSDVLYSNITIPPVLPVINGTVNDTSPQEGFVINSTFNATNNYKLHTAQIIINQTGFFEYFNFTNIKGNSTGTFSQNFTVACSAGCVINITGRVNDTANNLRQNETIFTVASAPTDTCSPTSPLTANYEYTCSDNCVISTVIDANGKNIACSGSSGTLNIASGGRIDNVNIFAVHGNCEFTCRNTEGCFG